MYFICKYRVKLPVAMLESRTPKYTTSSDNPISTSHKEPKGYRVMVKHWNSRVSKNHCPLRCEILKSQNMG